MNDVLISPCCLGDIPDLITIATTSYKQHYAYLWHDNGLSYMAKNFSERTLRQEMKEPAAAFYMIYFQNHLAGFLKLNLNSALAGHDADDCLELERIYLLAEATGQGVGQEVLDFTLRLAMELNKRVVWLKAMNSSSQVTRFYEKAGFEKCGSLQADLPNLKPQLTSMNLMKLELPIRLTKTRSGKAVGHQAYKPEMCIG